MELSYIVVREVYGVVLILAVSVYIHTRGMVTFDTARFSICGIRFPRRSNSLSLTGLM